VHLNTAVAEKCGGVSVTAVRPRPYSSRPWRDGACVACSTARWSRGVARGWGVGGAEEGLEGGRAAAGPVRAARRGRCPPEWPSGWDSRDCAFAAATTDNKKSTTAPRARVGWTVCGLTLDSGLRRRGQLGRVGVRSASRPRSRSRRAARDS
jgi:hypothetical protein